MSNASPAPEVKARNIFSDYIALTKPGITLLVLFSMSVGYVVASGGDIYWVGLLHAALGTLLIAGGTAAHNQYIERDLDKMMVRTVSRPLPAKKIKPSHALAFSLSMMAGGFLYLFFLVNPLTGYISALTSVLYLAFYTPMKRVTFLNVGVGAIPGALPPVGGWAAASGSLGDPVVWALFLIVFFWQVPHVISIAWILSEDYRAAGFYMLPKSDKNGTISSITILACLIVLIPVSLSLYHFETGNWIYLTGALVSGLLFLWSGLLFLAKRTKENARKVLYGSLIYLPAVWLFMLADLAITWFRAG